MQQRVGPAERPGERRPRFRLGGLVLALALGCASGGAKGSGGATDSPPPAKEPAKAAPAKAPTLLEAAEAGNDLNESKFYLCPVCGHIEFGTPPEKCPICNAPASKYVQV